MTNKGTNSNPFAAVATRDSSHARLLAHAFKGAHTASDVFAALRMARSLDLVSEVLSGYLDGYLFGAWSNGASDPESWLPDALPELRDLAWAYLEAM